MAATPLSTQRQRLLPGLAIALTLVLTVVALRAQGRLWICSCGRIDLWAGNTKSSDNSQHLADPYSFTYVLHGLVFYWLLARAFPRLHVMWQLSAAVAVEALWEVVENSEFIIQRYREATLALGYEGDTVVNAVGDIAWMALGFWLARKLGFRRSAALFVATEIVLILWIRDSLVLNIVMLLVPSDAIKNWQMGG
ncbi:MAG TPA: DUF2585 family protein [Herpetosiphonaceae bacterium]|nr:DUF2585 family protein [Herpetosiphonaceae bacterium]